MITYLKTLLFEFREQCEVKRRFYPHLRFREADCALLENYRGINPYRVCKHYLVEHGTCHHHQYGETPLTTMAKIAEECNLGPADTIIEMGAGRGRAALFLAEFVGCRVVAYEQIPLFVEKMVFSERLQMVMGDMFSAPLREGTAIFLYGTMLEDETISSLCEKFPLETKVITVSYPLSDYSDRYRVEKVFSGRFPWGKTNIYWNEAY